ncbi:MAG: Calcineurin-like phosphoesterase [Actinomycetia bacterium]|nr:Calcineurin-like phosphoesterase [Actinomycetes bacterium]
MPPGEHTVEVADRTLTVTGDGGPHAVVVDGLPAHTLLEVFVDGRWATTTATLEPPPGRELFRLATVGDLHMGDGVTFGVLPTVRDPGGEDDSPIPRATRAAVAELAGWGAQLLVAKGDLTHHGLEAEFALAAELLTGPGLPVVATIGNHDVRSGHVDGRPVLAAAGIELAVEGVVVRDVPGLRVVVADATIPGRHPGSFRTVGPAILDAAASAGGPVLVALHHQLQPLPVPTHWPPGVLGPASGRFLRALAEANPHAVVTSGHTHRNRARRAGPVLVTEVGSPKDHPGAWAGYVVHEGGIRQVVRRTMAPEVLRWTESTKRALFGVWGRWSPGKLDDRCLTHRWGAA